MSDFEQTFKLQLLPYGAQSPADFKEVAVNLDPLRHTCIAIKELLGVRGLLAHASAIIPDEALLKNWYDAGAPIIVVASAPDWEESDTWAKNPNPVARILNCHVPVECALVALGRCYWQQGFKAFFSAASVLRHLVDGTGTYDYQRRAEFSCLTRKELNPVMVYNEHSGKVLPPPILRNDTSGGRFRNEWVDVPKPNLSTEELVGVANQARQISAVSGTLNEASRAVVRVFGYHTVSDDDRLDVHSFTAFFVAPGLLMTARTASFNEATNTFAHSFRFTRRVRALHGMLEHGVDLFDLRPIDGLTETLVSRIHALGIALEENKVPPGMFASPWNDILLLEVVDAKQREVPCEILLPEVATEQVRRDEQLYAIAFSDAPTEPWIMRNFGPRGYNADGAITADDVRRQWWSHDVKCCSVGVVHEDCALESDSLKHTCSLLPGSRGAPVLRRLRSVVDGETLTFCALSCGRATELFVNECENIVAMSTSELARRDSLASNVFNEALPSAHLSLVLVYQELIQHRLKDPKHRAHIRRYLAPYEIFVDNTLLSACHAKMLLDADDHNEYGMDFYQHHDLQNALACFREGAKMFSTASIPNLTDHDTELKSALQTNVSAVVVARMNLVR
jgi:hypothetical protein